MLMLLFVVLALNSKTDGFSVGSCFGPVTVGASPVLVFKQNAMDGRWVNVATGSISSIDPDRIILKKVCSMQITYAA